MQRYYTTIETADDNYVGYVYNVDTNIELYKTKPYPSQSQVIKDINSFLATAKPPTVSPTVSTSIPNVITNNVTHVPGAPRTGGRCCGR